MRINLPKRFMPHVDGNHQPIEKPQRNLVQQVLDAPALFNRRTRRSIGLYGRFWRWDLNANEDTRRTFIPRYIRRHQAALAVVGPKRTRRERRHVARIMRIAIARGM